MNHGTEFRAHNSPEQYLKEVLDTVRAGGEVYLHTRFVAKESPIGQEEFQTTANQNALGKYDRLQILYAQSNCFPMYLNVPGSQQEIADAEQVVEIHPHRDGKQWIILYSVAGDKSCNDGTGNIVPLGIGVACNTKEKAEELLKIFEDNPQLIQPFFIEMGKEAQGSGVQAILGGNPSRMPKFKSMSKYLIMRADKQYFNARYINNQGDDIPQPQKMQEFISKTQSRVELNRQRTEQVTEEIKTSNKGILGKIKQLFTLE